MSVSSTGRKDKMLTDLLEHEMFPLFICIVWASIICKAVDLY